MGKEMVEIIKSICRSKGITIDRFEQDCGLAHGYLRSMSAQDSTPSAKRLDTMATYLGVSRSLLTGEEQNPSDKRGVIIPLLGRVAAGIPIEAAENVIGDEEITGRLAITGEFFALLIKGDSMSPYIMDGDKVIVRKQSEAESGDVVIALINGNDGCCKEYRKIPSGIMLISKNPSYDPMIFTHAEIDSQPVAILGKVVEVRRSL